MKLVFTKKEGYWSLYLVPLVGIFDAIQSWPWKGTVTMQLLSQDGSHPFTQGFVAGGICRPNPNPEAESTGMGFEHFCPVGWLTDPRYIGDGYLYIRCSLAEATPYPSYSSS